jgi:hypothetical protein
VRVRTHAGDHDAPTRVLDHQQYGVGDAPALGPPSDREKSGFADHGSGSPQGVRQLIVRSEHETKSESSRGAFGSALHIDGALVTAQFRKNATSSGNGFRMPVAAAVQSDEAWWSGERVLSRAM